MKILGIIPARSGSKGIPKKNSKLLGEKPLIAYTLEQARQSSLITDLILSSDDDEIILWAKENHLEVPFKRPSNLATDTASSLDVVLHALQFLENNERFYDAVCLLQPTSPFRANGLIDKAIEKFIETKVDSLMSVLKLPPDYNPHWVFEMDKAGNLYISTGEKEIIKRRQDLPSAYIRDGRIYITKTEILKENNSFYGAKIGYIESNWEDYCNIDTMEDWKRAEKLLKKLNK